ncbi:hypothetical protein [Bradyrhizobium sp.]|uniref:hypothetical protein n=1 Tax=Bradyrhizobium sp. TaxID=376 RepID=UPI0039E253ED
MRSSGSPTLGLARILGVSLGLLGVAWAASTFPVFRDEASLVVSAQHILSGEQYQTVQSNELGRELAGKNISTLRSTTLSRAVVVRLKLDELESASQKEGYNPDLDATSQLVGSALARDPADAFLWLTAYWLESVQGKTSADPRLLRMSYLLGPNEGWIATRRNPLAVRMFASLPPDVTDRVVAEFGSLVHSGLGQNAAGTLSGLDGPIREKLIGVLDADTRGWFLRALEGRDGEERIPPGARDGLLKLETPF